MYESRRRRRRRRRRKRSYGAKTAVASSKGNGKRVKGGGREEADVAFGSLIGREGGGK